MLISKSSSRLFLLSAALSIVFFFGACSSSSDSKPEPEAKELGVNPDQGQTLPEFEMVEEGKRLYESGLYTVARDQFEKLRNNYPLSPYAEFAELKIADSYFQSGEYQTAALGYEDFTKNHPVSESTAYALLMAGRSQQLINRGIGRDTAPLEKAREFYDRVLNNHSGSIYSGTAAKYKFEVERDLKAYDELVLAYYQKRNKENAVAVRNDALQTRWANVNTESPPPSAVTLASLPAATTFSPPEPQRLPSGSSASKTTGPAPSNPGANLVQRVECKSDQQQLITLFLTSAAGEPSKPSASADGLNFKLPRPNGQDLSVDCFANGDLKIAADGAVKLAGVRSAELFSLSNPARYVLIPGQN